ncbi:MAG: hypothetical protein HWE22_15545 [Flavobacteriales bacterium]|nr:hypothetical protein [Flavobacteriales bacterium]
MKMLFALFGSLFIGTLHAQSEAPFDPLTIDSLVNAHIGKYSVQSGNPVVIAGGDQPVIAFFEVQYLDSVEETPRTQFEPFYSGRPAVSMFQILERDTNHVFRKKTIDTLDANPGYSNCHMTDVVDSAGIVNHGKSTSLVLLVCHPVMITCNSMTYYYLQSYALSSQENPFEKEPLESVNNIDFYRQDRREKAFQHVTWKKVD